MPAVCLYFQIHQPFRLRKYTIFDSAHDYFDDGHNQIVIDRVAQHCYLPALRLLLHLVQQHQGRFRFALSITGSALEQLEHHAPETLHLLHALAQSGCVEFLAETYHHSLASLYSRPEFIDQVQLHRQILKRLFNIFPTTFRNTELIWSNDIARIVGELGFTTALAEGWAPVLNRRSPAFLFQSPTHNAHHVKLLLRNHHLSDLIAFRFSDRKHPDYPITVANFTERVASIAGHLCNLFMDFETFGEHQKADTGILDFLRALPDSLLAHNIPFHTPSEIALSHQSAGDLDAPQPFSWADQARDLSPWLGNAMQASALQDLYALERPLKKNSKPRALADWRRLTTSDHPYYMATKALADGDVHSYFSPYDSPYDAYINYMNVLDNLKSRL